MAYTKTTWKDRDVQYPNRYTKSGESSTQVTLEASAGVVTEEGTEQNAANFNKMEQGIKDAHDLVATAQTTADGKVNKSGDTMTGALTLSGNPTQNAHAANKAYVDAADTNLQTQITSLGTTKANVTYVDQKITDLVNGSPAALDTLNELATALGNDANFATTMTNQLATKAPLASPALTGTPTAPTATSGTNTTQIATTAFVQDAVTNLPAGSVTTSEIADGSVTAAKLDPNLPTNVGLGQLQTEVSGKVSKAGDTMTGLLTLSGNPTSDLHAATKQYVDAASSNSSSLAIVAGGTATAITLNVSGLSAYVPLGKYTFVASATDASTAKTININGLGAKNFYKAGTTSAPSITANKIYNVVLSADGTTFFLQASAEGTAVAGDVLAGKTFSNDSDTSIEGTMVNRGAVTITPSTTNQTIAAGYHNGSGVVAGDADLTAANIKVGTDIFGVIGTFTSDATAIAGEIKSGKTAYVNGVKLTGTGNVVTTLNIEYLIVAGGGGGGGNHAGGGGGAGGLLSGSATLNTGASFPIVVGGGGSGGAGSVGVGRGTSGSNSTFNSLTAIGGGGGASEATGLTALTGGSGGGGSGSSTSGNTTGASGTLGQGNSGGNGTTNVSGGYGAGAGGGGAGAAGFNASYASGGSGGAGVSSSITGSAIYYAGGGGGGGWSSFGGSGSSGGIGGGGAGAATNGGSSGTANTGGGGGGSGATESVSGTNSRTGGGGGSGVVIIRYLGIQQATGGTVTTSGGYTIHTFTSSGTFTVS